MLLFCISGHFPKCPPFQAPYIYLLTRSFSLHLSTCNNLLIPLSHYSFTSASSPLSPVSTGSSLVTLPLPCLGDGYVNGVVNVSRGFMRRLKNKGKAMAIYRRNELLLSCLLTYSYLMCRTILHRVGILPNGIQGLTLSHVRNPPLILMGNPLKGVDSMMPIFNGMSSVNLLLIFYFFLVRVYCT